MSRHSRYSRWEDAMITQARLFEWSMSGRGLSYLEGFFEEMNEKHAPQHRRDVRMLAAIQLQTLKLAEPVYMGHDAAELVDHARTTFKPEPCLPSDPFVPSGFLLLPRPFITHDAPPTKKHPFRSPIGDVPLRAIAWTSVHSEDLETGCFWISHYVDIDDELDLADGRDTRWGPGQADALRRMMPLLLAHQYQWTWGSNPLADDLEHDMVDGEEIEATKARATEQVALIQTIWRLGQQFLPSKGRAPRQIWRDARRKGIDQKDVNIIRLRRAREGYEPPEDPTGRHYRVQFPVHGYWAVRHFKEGPRQRWIQGHMKGPEDAPVKITDRAWEFTR